MIAPASRSFFTIGASVSIRRSFLEYRPAVHGCPSTAIDSLMVNGIPNKGSSKTLSLEGFRNALAIRSSNALASSIALSKRSPTNALICPFTSLIRNM